MTGYGIMLRIKGIKPEQRCNSIKLSNKLPVTTRQLCDMLNALFKSEIKKNMTSMYFLSMQYLVICLSQHFIVLFKDSIFPQIVTL